MNAETISALINMGSAGAVIVVVMVFLRSNKERDAEWRNFFTELNKNNQADVLSLKSTLERLVTSMTEHDQRMSMAITRMNERTRPTTARTRSTDNADE